LAFPFTQQEDDTMDTHELRDLGRQIARDIAAGLMAATAAGAAEFCREMRAARSAAEADGLSALAEQIDQEKQSLRQQIEAASGLKRLALLQRLQRLETAEQELCDQVLAQTPALPPPMPDTGAPDPDAVPVRAHVRRKPDRHSEG
jgi:hypothetical protein